MKKLVIFFVFISIVNAVYSQYLVSNGDQHVVGQFSVYPLGTIGDNAYKGNLVITKPQLSAQYINLVRQSAHPWSIGMVYNTSNFAIGTGSTVESNFTNPFFVIKTNGFIGIGTTAPDEKLTVKGKIHAEEVIIDLNVPLADYVFTPSYTLRPLSEVEEYVNTYRHLPEIPSAANVKANGLNLGEMQNLLLQKIEELTLYAIEQQKQIDELKQKLSM